MTSDKPVKKKSATKSKAAPITEIASSVIPASVESVPDAVAENISVAAPAKLQDSSPAIGAEPVAKPKTKKVTAKAVAESTSGKTEPEIIAKSVTVSVTESAAPAVVTAPKAATKVSKSAASKEAKEVTAAQAAIAKPVVEVAAVTSEAKPKTELKSEAKPEPKSEPKLTPKPVSAPANASVSVSEPVPSTDQVADPSNPVPSEEPGSGFRALNLSEATMRAVIEAGFEAPTPIQEQAIPILLSGLDLIGQAQTGTGKTAAFALPMADILDSTLRYPQAIILLPTRELCIQVAQETHNLSKFRNLKVVPVYGGQPIDRQFRALSMGAQVVVGTPGRVLDHLRRGTLNLTKVRMVILDEADEMLNMGFIEDVEEILKDAPAERQTALFSATMPPRIAALAKAYLKDPERVNIESKRRTVANVTQKYYEVVPSQKVEALSRILDMESPGSTIIFCRTRRDVDDLGESLQMRGYEAETLHGEMNQAARDRVMNRFRSSQADLLIATDVAARGLDIDQVTHVINYDIPWDVESYIHRIGRTGRAGRSGEAITLVSPRERYQLRLIERTINAPITVARVPTASDIASRRREMFKVKLIEVLDQNNYDGFLMTVEELMEEGNYDSSQIAGAALQMLWQTQKGAADYNIAEANVESERTETGMSRLFLQIGRQDGIRPGDIVGAIANEAGVPGSAIGAIDIMDRSAFVEVPEADATRVIEALNRTKMRGKRVYAELARPRTETGPPPQGEQPYRQGSGGYAGGGRPPQGNYQGNNHGNSQGNYQGNSQGGYQGNSQGGPRGYAPRGNFEERDRFPARGNEKARYDRPPVGKKPHRPDSGPAKRPPKK